MRFQIDARLHFSICAVPLFWSNFCQAPRLNLSTNSFKVWIRDQVKSNFKIFPAFVLSYLFMAIFSLHLGMAIWRLGTDQIGLKTTLGYFSMDLWRKQHLAIIHLPLLQTALSATLGHNVANTTGCGSILG